MLYLIGLGLHNEKDISLRGLETAKKADKVFIELYTNTHCIHFKNLEKSIGKKITVLDRKQVEETDIILKSAKKQKTIFFVSGDPLAATTHLDLVMQARKNNIKVEIIHSSSIFSAIGEAGLSIYKFGKTVSLPIPEKNYCPTSPYDNIEDNLKMGLHTLVLPHPGMTANEALNLLLDLEKRKKKNVISENKKIVVAAHLGHNSLVKYDKIHNLLKQDFGNLPHSLIMPGKLHFQEKEFLSELK